MSTVAEYLTAFSDLRAPGPSEDPWVSHHPGSVPGPHVVVGALVHGDEVGSLPAVIRLMRELRSAGSASHVTVTVFLGNPDAARAGRRFLDDDLNRVFVAVPPDNLEGRRARALKPVLDQAEVFLDLHQTIQPTDRAFYIFPFTTPGWRWARAIGGATTWVTRASDQAFSPGTCCADEYVRLAGRPGLTLELGQRGFTAEAEDRAYRAITRLLQVAAITGGGAEALQAAAVDRPELEFVETRWRCAFNDARQRLRTGFVNFEVVSAGTVLSEPGTPEIVAPVDGYLLFPKYPRYHEDGRVIEPRPGEIVRIVAPLAEHPASVWGG